MTLTIGTGRYGRTVIGASRPFATHVLQTNSAFDISGTEDLTQMYSPSQGRAAANAAPNFELVHHPRTQTTQTFPQDRFGLRNEDRETSAKQNASARARPIAPQARNRGRTVLSSGDIAFRIGSRTALLVLTLAVLGSGHQLRANLCRPGSSLAGGCSDAIDAMDEI